MATDRRNARAIASDIALHEQEVDQHGDIVGAVDLLGQPHAVDADDLFGLPAGPASRRHSVVSHQ